MKQEKIAIQIKKLDLEFDKISNKLLKPYGLTHTQFKIIMFLFKEADTIIKQIDIERNFGLTNPTVTGILHNLEKMDLVQRTVNPNDVRSKAIILTGKARAMEEDLLIIGAAIEEHMTKGLTGTEMTQLAFLLDKLLLNIKN